MNVDVESFIKKMPHALPLFRAFAGNDEKNEKLSDEMFCEYINRHK